MSPHPTGGGFSVADEYDAAQERGEVLGAHNGAVNRVADDNAIATSSDLGLRRDQIHKARRIRDAHVFVYNMSGTGERPLRGVRLHGAAGCVARSRPDVAH